MERESHAGNLPASTQPPRVGLLDFAAAPEAEAVSSRLIGGPASRPLTQPMPRGSPLHARTSLGMSPVPETASVGNFTATRYALPGPVLVPPRRFGDHRGFFLETYSSRDFAALGLADVFVQDNHSLSAQ